MPTGFYIRTKPAWNKNKRLSEETRQKMSMAKIGKKRPPFTEEHKRKIGLSSKGRHYSKETKLKMSVAQLGRKHSPRTEETKRKISLANKGRKHSPRTEETKRKISLSHKGSKSYLWKGGITPILKKIRNSTKYNEWRQSIYIRDDFTCQICGEKGGRLNAHHKNKSFSELIEEVSQNLPLMDLYEGAMLYTPFWNMKNGITLCKKCHYTH